MYTAVFALWSCIVAFAFGLYPPTYLLHVYGSWKILCSGNFSYSKLRVQCDTKVSRGGGGGR